MVVLLITYRYNDESSTSRDISTVLNLQSWVTAIPNSFFPDEERNCKGQSLYWKSICNA